MDPKLQPINIKRTDLVLQYILAVAGQESGWDRELGMIHLVKYVYLADFEYSKKHNGESYTGNPWKFHHLGPWSVDCFHRIEPALTAIAANRRSIESKKHDDFYRWSVDDDELFESLSNQLDLIVMGAVQKYIKMFGSDTYGLLDYVYKTGPMVSAAPGELLDFKKTEAIKKSFEDKKTKIELTAKQKKLRRKRIIAFKEQINKKLEQKVKESRIKTCPLPPRYDEVFFEGLAQLDAAAGSLPKEGEYIAIFNEDVWKSKARNDPELS